MADLTNPKREAVAQNDDLIAVPREVLAAANYIIRKGAHADSKTAVALRKYALGPAILALGSADVEAMKVLKIIADDELVDGEQRPKSFYTGIAHEYLSTPKPAEPADELFDRAELAWQRFFYPAADCFDGPDGDKHVSVDLEVADCLRLVLAHCGRLVVTPAKDVPNVQPTPAVEALREALEPFAAIKPSSIYGESGLEDEGYCVILADGHGNPTEFTGLDLARARAALAVLTPADGSGGEG